LRFLGLSVKVCCCFVKTKEGAMLAWAERLLYLGVVSFALGVLLRLAGYHDQHGFLQPPLSRGISPGAFLEAGAVCAIFAASMAMIDLARRGMPKDGS
jgi:hypothetical protein